jgi:hypothetical protein
VRAWVSREEGFFVNSGFAIERLLRV